VTVDELQALSRRFVRRDVVKPLMFDDKNMNFEVSMCDDDDAAAAEHDHPHHTWTGAALCRDPSTIGSRQSSKSFNKDITWSALVDCSQ
jgi:hypothetical protein